MSTKKQPTKKEIFDMLTSGEITIEDYEAMLREMYPEKYITMFVSSAKTKLEEIKKQEEGEKENTKKQQKRFWEDTKSKTIYESIFNADGWGQFLSKSFSEDIGNKPEWNFVNNVPHGEVTFVPDASLFNPNGRYNFSGAHVYNNIPQLSYYFPDVKLLLKKFVYLAESQYDLIATNILLSYQQHKFGSIGYIGIISLPEGGKSILGHLICRLAYRAFFATSKLNASNIYNFIGTDNEGDCTLIMDEFQEFMDDKNPENREVLAILRSGYQKGASVPRILDASSHAREQVWYKTYNLKFLLGNSMPYDDALKSRTIEEHIMGMPRGWVGEDEIKPEHEKLFNDLRVKMLLSRMVHYYDALPELDREKYAITGRIGEIWRPMIKTVAGTPYEANIEAIFRKWNSDLETEKKGKLENKLALVVSALMRDWTQIPFTSIWSALCHLLQEPDEKTASEYESQILDKKVSKKSVGFLLRNFGGVPAFSKFRYYVFKKESMEIIRYKYLVSDEEVDNFYLELKMSDMKELLKPAVP